MAPKTFELKHPVMMDMKDCPRFISCNANLCPLDRDLHHRTWIPGEDICHRQDFKELPWIRRQRKINRTRPESIEGSALKIEYLTRTAPVKRILSDRHREALRSHQFAKKCLA